MTRMLNESSLCKTLDLVSESLFFARKQETLARLDATRWIMARQGLPRAYGGLFAPTDGDYANGIRLFTGERVTSRAGVGHILGEEALRVINVARHDIPEAVPVIAKAAAGMAAQVDACVRRGYSDELYCCGTCSAAYWKNLAAGLLPRSAERLEGGLRILDTKRNEDGTWARFPFFYTCLTLVEIDLPSAREQLRHSAKRWEKLLPRLERSNGVYETRRAELGRRVLVRA